MGGMAGGARVGSSGSVLFLSAAAPSDDSDVDRCMVARRQGQSQQEHEHTHAQWRTLVRYVGTLIRKHRTLAVNNVARLAPRRSVQSHYVQ